jgi:hypothetical protein
MAHTESQTVRKPSSVVGPIAGIGASILSLVIGLIALTFQFVAPASISADPPILTIEQEFNAKFFPNDQTPPPIPTTPPPAGSPPSIEQEYEEWLNFLLFSTL